MKSNIKKGNIGAFLGMVGIVLGGHVLLSSADDQVPNQIGNQQGSNVAQELDTNDLVAAGRSVLRSFGPIVAVS